MNGLALFWIVIFICSALLFFAIAAVAGIRGVFDLRALLLGSEHRKGPPEER